MGKLEGKAKLSRPRVPKPKAVPLRRRTCPSVEAERSVGSVVLFVGFPMTDKAAESRRMVEVTELAASLAVVTLASAILSVVIAELEMSAVAMFESVTLGV